MIQHPPKARRSPAVRTRLATFLPALLMLGGCGGPAPETDEGTLPVVASIFPVADLARSLGGEEIRVHVLLGPGSSPATFDPTPSTLRAVEGARLALFMGGGLDAWTRDVLDAAPRARPVRLLEGIPLRGQGPDEGTGNPHVWLDPVLTRDRLLPRIADALAAALPDQEDRIRERQAALADSLGALDREIRTVLGGLTRRTFVASHPAWTYYAERYGLRELAVVHAHPGQEHSARGVAEIVDRARAEGVGAVFTEPQIPDAGARTLARELGVPLLALDPLGGEDVPGRDSYRALLRYNTRQFQRGLSGEGDP